MPADALLAIDAGNTRIKWGLGGPGAWARTGSAPTAQPAALAAAWRGLPAPAAAIACNVAGPAVEAGLRGACEALGVPLRVVRPVAAAAGVVNGYRDPSQLGADRWAALVAAHAAAAGHKLVVMAGTALTIDALAADGRFLGGLIVPGPALMRRALGEGTAGLRHTEGAFDPFPRSTPDAITSGALQALAGAVRQMHEAMAAQGMEVRQVLLSGGAAGEIAPRLPIGCAIHENLVLDGLALLARTA